MYIDTVSLLWYYKKKYSQLLPSSPWLRSLLDLTFDNIAGDRHVIFLGLAYDFSGEWSSIDLNCNL